MKWWPLFCSFFISSLWASVDIKFGTVAPAGTPWADSLEQIKLRVAKESQEKLKVKTYLGGQLGGEIEILQGLRRGRIQGGGLTSGALASVIPEMDVLELPYLFESFEEADFVLDNYLLDPFEKLFLSKDLILVTWAENGWRNIGHKERAIKKISDLKGVKIRSQETKTHLSFWKNLGASPQAIATPEVLPALQTGVVEAFDNTPLFTLAAEWHTAIKHFTITEHIYQPAAVVYSKKFWDKLSDSEKKILMGEGNAQALTIRKAVRALGSELIGVLKDSNINVVSLSDSERKNFQTEAEKMRPQLLKQISGEAEKIYQLVLQGKRAFKEKK